VSDHRPSVSLDRLRQVAELYDAGIRIPGTRFHIGLDPLIGLIPGLGDLIGAGVALWIVAEAIRLGASGFVLFRMLVNIAIDTLGGAIPVAGDVFDALWKANLKNVRLLERHLATTAAVEGVTGRS
jgi:Domain of unknown function (DUF4112)